MTIKGIIIKDLLSDLKETPLDINSTYFLIGRDTMGDGKGGFYYYDPTSAEAEDNTYMNIIMSNVTSTGRLKRVFSRAIQLPQGVLIITGGVKTLYSTASFTTNASGEATINLTMDNTANGTAIFNEIWWNKARSVAGNITSANDIVVSDVKSVSGNLKQTTHYFARGNYVTLGSTLLSILGLIIPGLRPALTNNPVAFKVEGI